MMTSKCWFNSVPDHKCKRSSASWVGWWPAQVIVWMAQFIHRPPRSEALTFCPFWSSLQIYTYRQSFRWQDSSALAPKYMQGGGGEPIREDVAWAFFLSAHFVCNRCVCVCVERRQWCRSCAVCSSKLQQNDVPFFVLRILLCVFAM